tara:strand:+ start:261 stop:374 length:114 start_codon:yes stop_codon:yes gene_type:complete
MITKIICGFFIILLLALAAAACSLYFECWDEDDYWGD